MKSPLDKLFLTKAEEKIYTKYIQPIRKKYKENELSYLRQNRNYQNRINKLERVIELQRNIIFKLREENK